MFEYFNFLLNQIITELLKIIVIFFDNLIYILKDIKYTCIQNNTNHNKLARTPTMSDIYIHGYTTTEDTYYHTNEKIRRNQS